MFLLSERQARSLDDIDWKILDELQKDARISVEKLARDAGVPPAEAESRIRRMEEDGVISGYGATVNPRRAGYPLSALVGLSTKEGNPDQIINDELATTPEVLSCWSVTGTSDYLLEVQAPSLEFLEELLSDLARHGRLTTSIVLPSSAKKRHIQKPRLSMTD